MRKTPRNALIAFLTLSFILSGCGAASQDNTSTAAKAPAVKTETKTEATAAAEKLNQPPVDPIIKREGKDVFIEMTAQVTDVEIAKGVKYNAWTFNGTAPGPVLRVKEGDTIHFTLKNLDPNIPHSMDFHAVHASPSSKFIDVMPNESGTFEYPATTPGVFMYHCGTKPVLAHIANGMHGVIIVEPNDGYPTDHEIDREYVITQNEWYEENDMKSFLSGEAKYVVFNGSANALTEHPLLAKAGDKVRLYVNNLGPNHVSSFHVVGTIFDTVYLDGNPQNKLYGMQTVMLPASGGAVVEFTVTEEGDYPIVTHQFNDATKGAVGILRVTKDGKDTGEAAMGH
jgi:nitrite reductase (NO-forming)